MECILLLLVGVLIGWHVPQPEWVKKAIEWVKAKISKEEQK